MLTETQVQALEKAKQEGEIDTAHPGYLAPRTLITSERSRPSDAFISGPLLTLDSNVGFTRLYDRKNALVAADTLNEKVLSPGPMTLQVNVQGQGAAQFVAGQVVTPEFVQAQWSSAAAGSNGRLQNSAVIQQPGLVIA